jgi:hypothetical protein
VLVFFPSYGVMDNTVTRWKETGCFNKLQVAGGAVIIEPRTNSIIPQRNNNNKFKSNNQDSSPKKYKNSFVNSNDNNENGEETEEIQLSGIVKEFENTLQRNGRCILLAVCRGKVSEGIDFRDQKGRVVIITGLPYAPHLDPWVVLKRMYLDEKCKISNSIQYDSSSSSYNNNPIYPVKSNPYTSILAPNKDDIIPSNESVMKIQPVSNPHSNPYATQLIMAPPPPKVVTNTVISNKNKITPLKLDGQGWYNQSASRAVNQAMGRIIRHKSDWGAVFLLDDRFQYERQKSQLSSWLRSSVNKHVKFMPALQQFRSFITHCMNDPNLNLISEYESLIPLNMQPPPMQYNSSNDLNKFTREVIVDSNALQSGEDINYIDPNLLLTQLETDYVAPYDSNAFDDEDDEDDNEFNLNNITSKMKPITKNNTNSIIESSPRISQGISDIFANKSVLVRGNSLNCENKNKPPVPSNFISNTNSNSIGLINSTSSNNNIGLSSHNNNQKQQHIDKQPIAGLSKHCLGLSVNSAIEAGNWNKKTNKIVFGLNSSSSSSTNINTNKIDIKENNKSNNIKNELMNIVGLIKNKLSSENFIEFNKLLINIKNNELSDVNQLRDFTSKLIVIFKNIDLKEKEEILLSLKIFLPCNLIEIYKSMIQKACQRPISKSQSSSSTLIDINKDINKDNNKNISKDINKDNNSTNKSKPSLSSFLNGNSKVADMFKLIRKPNINATSIKNSTITTSVTSASPYSATTTTKRTTKPKPNLTTTTMNNNNYYNLTNKRPISEVSSNTTTKNINQINNIQNQKPSTEIKTNDSINISRNEKPNLQISELNKGIKSNNNDNNNSFEQPIKVPKSNNFICPVCSEAPTTPCAAKSCGHVCCATCWLQWLRNNQTCPICRTFTTTKSITKVIIK